MNSAQIPQNRIYYGWCNVGVGMLSMALAPAVMAFFTLGVYMPVLTAEFDWTRTQISAASMIGTLTSAAVTPIIGKIVDAIGVRALLMSALGLFAVTFASFYFLSLSLVHFYLGYFVIGLTAPITTLSYSRTIVAWFNRNRGLALGLTMAGTGLGAAVLPPLAQHLIETIGWRLSYVTLGVLAGAVSIPLIGLFLREKPDENDVMGRANNAQDSVSTDINYGMIKAEAVKTSTFWTLVAMFFLISVSLHAITVHLVPILIDAGFAAGSAAGYMAIFGSAVIIGRLVCGFTVDRVFAPYVASGVFLLSAVATVSLLFIGSTGLLPAISAFLFGLGIGAETDLLGYLVARYFGLINFGQVYGYIFSAFMLGTSVGPLFLGVIFDTAGSYDIGLVILAVMMLGSSVAALRLGEFPTWNFAGTHGVKPA